MPNWQVIVDLNATEEVDAFSVWLDRWRDRIVVSENEGCGCCVDIWQVNGPDEARAELPDTLRGDGRPSANLDENLSSRK